MKNIFQKNKLINIIIVFISHILLINCDYTCSIFTDCFNCTMCGEHEGRYCNCEWDNDIGLCQSVEMKYLDEWYKELLICKDNLDQTIFCSGQDTLYTKNDLDKNNSIKFQIQSQSSGRYGKRMLFCYYNYIDEDSNDYLINIEFSDSLTSKPQIAYGCHYKETGEDKIENINQNTEVNCLGCYKIFFVALLNREYTSSPFFFKITLNSKGSKFVTGFTIALIIILVITSIICCITRFYNNRSRRQLRVLLYQRARENMIRIEQEINNWNNNHSNYENNENIEETNKIKLDELFAKQMAEHLYKSEYNEYGGGCSICLDNFKKKSKVSITPCKHVFHYKCIKDWLYKNALNPKCPNCNKEVLVNDENDLNGKSDETKIIKIKKNTQNNMLNSHINFVGRNNINIANVSINSGIVHNNIIIREESSRSQRPQLGDY